MEQFISIIIGLFFLYMLTLAAGEKVLSAVASVFACISLAVTIPYEALPWVKKKMKQEEKWSSEYAEAQDLRMREAELNLLAQEKDSYDRA